ncbi:class I SAM-dependent methyltransferase [Kribbella shirazensis]|uniref:2-polyprenyl-3-methyl-5-hydroxy-6-metoxy-1, 4-benzoquinol methylase n=1 Tax=Kribbella shirazensis TaxID=1105143 RepID=A0A7X5ZZ19_9ACTN|nr:class I SAM-dependent methyltransferase [Kribbella shirazensis]NIK55473.1 2-polyprenyl-3-methyl-5-hydroxy-6-metoxy-1,4-benzoquinol methylase [Kribbella shirazensis]
MPHAITESNRASWNQIHHARPGLPASYFAAGGTTLSPAELAAAGDVRGRRVLQLACSCGDEVLSWASLGASVVGVDISEVAITMATEKSTSARIPADFLRADMLDLPSTLTGFDLIYLSWGAICWVPDLAAFATSIATRLTPGGTILIADHHPIWEVLSVRGPDHLTVTADYFARTTPRATIDNAKLPTGARDNSEAPTFTAFIWPPSDIITALLAASLTLTTFQESPVPEMYDGLGPTATWVPATYLIGATRNVSHETLRKGQT